MKKPHDASAERTSRADVGRRGPRHGSHDPARAGRAMTTIRLTASAQDETRSMPHAKESSCDLVLTLDSCRVQSAP